jgi:hypothetical protein
VTARPPQSKTNGTHRPAIVAGLDPAAPYSSRLSARSALFTELHQLLDGETKALSSAEYRRRVVDENRLAKPSKAAREKLWKELKARYRLDAEDPLFAAFWTEWTRCTSEPERSLTAYVFFALNDRLVTDLGLDLLYPLLRRAPAELRLADVLAFVERAYRAHPEARAWSDETRTAVAQKYTASIRDFGLARGTIRKTSIRPALYGAPVRLLVRAAASCRCRAPRHRAVASLQAALPRHDRGHRCAERDEPRGRAALPHAGRRRRTRRARHLMDSMFTALIELSRRRSGTTEA